MSRIHLSLGYDALSDDARTQIWENLFQKLKDDYKSGGSEIRYDYDAKQYVTKNEDVKALKWNGREIRNGKTTHVPLLCTELIKRLQRSKQQWPLPCMMQSTRTKDLCQRSLNSTSSKS